MAKPLSGDQGLASQAHSLQIVLFGPLTCEPNTILWVVTNCPYTNVVVLTFGVIDLFWFSVYNQILLACYIYLITYFIHKK